MVIPPSIIIVCPVICDEVSDERKNNPEFHSVVSNYLSELSLDEELMLEKI